MPMPSRLFQVVGGVFALCISGVITAYLYFSSPHVILRHALHLQTVPKSVKNLKMGSDVWTDEVRCFYLTIAPDEFPQLLAGRNYSTNIGPAKMVTMHISPQMKVAGNVSYTWQTNSADCKVFADDSHEHVIVIFSAD